LENKRISKDEYYLGIAKEVSRRCTCLRRRIGVVIVRDDQIVGTGYVGAPRKTKDCLERGFCLRSELRIPSGQRYELCRSVHAEANAIINAARAGVSLLKGTIYIWGSHYGEENSLDATPCFICKKMIINAGLAKVVCSSKDGKIKTFLIFDWETDWKVKDIIDDKEQYGIPIRKEEFKK